MEKCKQIRILGDKEYINSVWCATIRCTDYIYINVNIVFQFRHTHYITSHTQMSLCKYIIRHIHGIIKPTCCWKFGFSGTLFYTDIISQGKLFYQSTVNYSHTFRFSYDDHCGKHRETSFLKNRLIHLH